MEDLELIKEQALKAKQLSAEAYRATNDVEDMVDQFGEISKLTGLSTEVVVRQRKKLRKVVGHASTSALEAKEAWEKLADTLRGKGELL